MNSSDNLPIGTVRVKYSTVNGLFMHITYKNDFLWKCLIIMAFASKLSSVEASENNYANYTISTAANFGQESSNVDLSGHELNIGGRLTGGTLNAKVMRGPLWGEFKLSDWTYEDKVFVGSTIEKIRVKRVQSDLKAGGNIDLTDTPLSILGAKTNRFSIGGGIGKESLPSQSIKALYPYRAIYEDFWVSYLNLDVGLFYSFESVSLSANLNSKFISPGAYSFSAFEAKISAETKISQDFSAYVELGSQESSYRDTKENNQLAVKLYTIGLRYSFAER